MLSKSTPPNSLTTILFTDSTLESNQNIELSEQLKNKKIVSGLFDPALGTFSTGAYNALNNDTLLQVSGGESANTINNFLLLNSGAVTQIAFTSKIGVIS